MIELFYIFTGCGHMKLHVLKLYTDKYTVQVKLGTSEEEQKIVAMSYSVEMFCSIVPKDVIREKPGKGYVESVLFLSVAGDPQLSQ